MLIEMREMTDNGQGQDNWLLRVEKIESLLNIGVQSLGVSKSKTARLSKLMKGKFDVYWLNKINEIKMNASDDQNHNKLRVYWKFKGSFTREPYVDYVKKIKTNGLTWLGYVYQCSHIVFSVASAGFTP